MSSVLYDTPGPRGRRRILIGSLIGGALLLGLLALAVSTLARQGIFDAERWDIFAYPDVWEGLLRGLWATLRAAAVAAVLAVLLGVVLTAARLSGRRAIVVPARIFIELFRGLPVLLLMFFGTLALGLSFYLGVVLGLTLYNGAIIAEILRAGVNTLPRGQREAGLALGLDEGQTFRLIQLPQAVRIMLPSLISQLVVLLKDTSLGTIVAYAELLRVVQQLRDFYGSSYLFSIFFVGTAMYITVNGLFSLLANYVSRRTAKTRVMDPTEGSLLGGGLSAEAGSADNGP